MYQALYRKYRPKTFDHVIGQEHITQTLRRQVASGHTSHAYLFVGPRGTGKTTCAKILSRALNCQHPVDGNPCNQCPSCLGIESGSILDVVEIDAASNNGVDNIRSIREEAIFTPASVKKRVYIIDEVHMLSGSAFNALLKILEEPPEHLVFILATTELNKIPATILSRCQRFLFKRITPADIAARLSYVSSMEGIELTDGAAQLLSRLADGSMRDALSLLDQCRGDGVVDENRVLSSVGLSSAVSTAELWNKLSAGDLQSGLSQFEATFMNGGDPGSILGQLLTSVRDMMIVKIAPQSAESLISGSLSPKQLYHMGKNLSLNQLVSCSDTLQDSISRLSAARDKRTTAEVCLIKLSSILRLKIAETGSPFRTVSSDPISIEKKPTKPSEPSGSVPTQSAPSEKAKPSEKEAPESETPSEKAPRQTESAPTSEENSHGYAVSHPEPEPPVLYPKRDETPTPEVSAEKTEAKPDVQSRPSADVTSSTGAGQTSDLWERISRELSTSPDISFMLSSATCSARESGGTVTITTENDFLALMLSTKEKKELIAKACEKLLGRSYGINIVKGEVVRSVNNDKLNDLAKFDNVKFLN